MLGGFWIGGNNESMLWPVEMLMIPDTYSKHIFKSHADAGRVTIMSIDHVDTWVSWTYIHRTCHVGVRSQQFREL
jgi:hypothetical protein